MPKYMGSIKGKTYTCNQVLIDEEDSAREVMLRPRPSTLTRRDADWEEWEISEILRWNDEKHLTTNEMMVQLKRPLYQIKGMRDFLVAQRDDDDGC